MNVDLAPALRHVLYRMGFLHSPSRGLVGDCRCRRCTALRDAARAAGKPWAIAEHLAAGFAAADGGVWCAACGMRLPAACWDPECPLYTMHHHHNPTFLESTS